MLKKKQLKDVNWANVVPYMPVATPQNNGLLSRQYASFHPSNGWGLAFTSVTLYSGAGCYLITVDDRAYIARSGTTGTPSIRRMTSYSEQNNESFYYDGSILYMKTGSASPMISVTPLNPPANGTILLQTTEEDLAQFEQITVG